VFLMYTDVGLIQAVLRKIIKRIIRNCLSILIITTVSIFLLEFTLPILRGYRFIQYRKPSSSNLWNANHPLYGVWHSPNSSDVMKASCLSATIKTNSLGARDRERQAHSTGNRVIVLGDSFIEGWGLEQEQRLTDLLEEKTKIEHINLGMTHFGTYQELLVYKHFSKSFEHNALIIGLLPTNDFLDNNFDLTKSTLPDYLYRYRPYLIKKSDKWIHFNYTENFIKRFLRRNSHLYAAVESLMHSIPKNQLANERSKLRSNFYDYDKASLEQFVEILRRFREEGKKTKIAVVIIPVEEDLKRFAHEKDDLSPLYKELQPYTDSLDIKLVSLLPFFHKEKTKQGNLYHECDYHWNARANEIAAQYLIQQLGETIYTPSF
jgi:hypothetical protein